MNDGRRRISRQAGFCNPVGMEGCAGWLRYRRSRGRGDILNPFSALTSKIFGALLVVSILCLPLAYCKGRSDGKAIIRAAVAEASQKALKKAVQAETKADGSKTERDATFQQSQETIKEAVDEAIANDSDPISSYFDGLRASQN